jgi:hypothetical protein
MPGKSLTIVLMIAEDVNHRTARELFFGPGNCFEAYVYVASENDDINIQAGGSEWRKLQMNVA